MRTHALLSCMWYVHTPEYYEKGFLLLVTITWCTEQAKYWGKLTGCCSHHQRRDVRCPINHVITVVVAVVCRTK